MNNLQVFRNTAFGELNILIEGEKILFPATESAKMLGYANPHKAIADHCRYLTKREVPHPQNPDTSLEMNFIPEGDLYRLIVKSQLPEAEQFEGWVFDEVLPSIRKTGQFDVLHFNQLKLETKKIQLEYDQQSRASLTSLLDSLKDRYTPEQLIALSTSITGIKAPRSNQLRVAGHAKKIKFPPRTRLEEFRKLQNLTQEKMGKKIGLSKTQYNRIETGHRCIEGTDIEAFAKSFKMPYDQAMQLLCDS